VQSQYEGDDTELTYCEFYTRCISGAADQLTIGGLFVATSTAPTGVGSVVGGIMMGTATVVSIANSVVKFKMCNKLKISELELSDITTVVSWFLRSSKPILTSLTAYVDTQLNLIGK
jgi:hypothetical protein